MITVLLVHDNTDLLDATRSTLEKMGEVRVDTVNSIKHAVEVLKTRSYDIIVSYYRLPEVNGIEFLSDMNGIEFLKYLKMNGNATPFILYTRHGPDKVVVEDLNYAAELAVSRGGTTRQPLTELRDMIKQAVTRRRSERDLAIKFDMLNAILGATPLSICQMHGRVIDWANPPMSRLLGYEEGLLAGKSAQVLFPSKEEYDHCTRELVMQVGDDGWGYGDAKLVRKDGKSVNVRLRARLADPQDPSKGEVWVGEDVSEKIALTEELRQSELRYRELMHNANSIIMKIDPEGTITFFNKAAQSFFGYSGPEILGKNVVGTIFPATTRSGRDLTSMMDAIDQDSEGCSIRINENVLRTGDSVWVAWTNKAIRDDTGRITEILCIGNDITDHDSHDRVRISTAMWKDRVITGTDVKEGVFDAVFHICMDISREGREGKQVGTSFIVGDSDNVLAKSRQLILNPFEGHRREDRMVTNPDLKENIKELAQLDGAFIIRGDGTVEAAGRYITIDTSTACLPKGLGTRHSSVAGMTQATSAIGIVVSQSGGKISIFRGGQIVQEIA